VTTDLGKAVPVVTVSGTAHEREVPRSRQQTEIYPLLLLVGLYGQLDVLNRGVVRAHDTLVQQWEVGLFGVEVELAAERAHLLGEVGELDAGGV